MGADPDYCASCGTELTTVEPGHVYHCEACGDLAFADPTPNARVTVLDGDRVLLVEIADEARIEDPPYESGSEWMTPGGHLTLGEQPQEAAARELEEETGLAVDPDALALVDVVCREVVEGAHALLVLYGVERSATTGTLEAASDAADARFWSPAKLADAEARFRELHAEPEPCRDLEWWVREARDAIGRE